MKIFEVVYPLKKKVKSTEKLFKEQRNYLNVKFTHQSKDNFALINCLLSLVMFKNNIFWGGGSGEQYLFLKFPFF